MVKSYDTATYRRMSRKIPENEPMSLDAVMNFCYEIFAVSSKNEE